MSAGGRGKAGAEREAGRIAPGEHLRAELRRIGLDQVAVSKAAGVSRQSVNNIINSRQSISRAMAGKLGRLTGHSSDYWLRDWFLASGAEEAAAGAAGYGAGLLVNHQIARAVKDGVIGITPFSLSNLRPSSVALTLGGTLAAGGGARVSLTRGRSFSLAPGRAVSARTAESIDMPHDHLGRIGAAGGLCGSGIVVTGALHVEPGFKGHIRFCLFNAGDVAFRLRAGEAVVGLEIVRLAAMPEAVAT